MALFIKCGYLVESEKCLTFLTLCLLKCFFIVILFVLQGESEHINLKVLGQDNAIVQFKIKKHTPLRKLMNAYCDRAVSAQYCLYG